MNAPASTPCQGVGKREGIDVSFSALCDYTIQLHERLDPLKALFRDYAAEQALWNLEETAFQVLQEPECEPRQKSCLWAMRARQPGQQMVAFHYDERRNYEALSSWLEQSSKTSNGVSVTDEHKSYQQLTNGNPGIQTCAGCWTRAR